MDKKDNQEIEEQLIQTVYRSRSLISEEEEGAILQKSQKNNPAIDTTGVLVSHGGWFLQVLEGPNQNILKLLEKIQSDPRHTDVHVMSTRTITKRDFKEWSMASVRLDAMRFTDLVNDCLAGRNQALEEVRGFLCYGVWK